MAKEKIKIYTIDIGKEVKISAGNMKDGQVHVRMERPLRKREVVLSNNVRYINGGKVFTEMIISEEASRALVSILHRLEKENKQSNVNKK